MVGELVDLVEERGSCDPVMLQELLEATYTTRSIPDGSRLHTSTLLT